MSSVSPRPPSQGVLPGWKGVEAVTWRTASVAPAGALSCLSRPSVRRSCVHLRTLCGYSGRGARARGRAPECVSPRRKQSRNMAHGRASRELSQEGRQPRQLALLPLTHTRAWGWWGLQAGPRVLCHPIHLFSICVICTAWGFGRPGHCRIQKMAFECPDRPFLHARPSPNLLFFILTAHYLPVTKQECDIACACTTKRDPRPPSPLSTILSFSSPGPVCSLLTSSLSRLCDWSHARPGKRRESKAPTEIYRTPLSESLSLVVTINDVGLIKQPRRHKKINK